MERQHVAIIGSLLCEKRGPIAVRETVVLIDQDHTPRSDSLPAFSPRRRSRSSESFVDPCRQNSGSSWPAEPSRPSCRSLLKRPMILPPCSFPPPPAPAPRSRAGQRGALKSMLTLTPPRVRVPGGRWADIEHWPTTVSVATDPAHPAVGCSTSPARQARSRGGGEPRRWSSRREAAGRRRHERSQEDVRPR